MDATPPTFTVAALDRRAALKAALGGAAAAAVLAGPTISSFTVAPPYAAAASGTVLGVVMRKAGSGSQPPTAPCTAGPDTDQGQKRGHADFSRTENPAQICVTITLSTGQSSLGRTVQVFHSAGGSCIGTTTAGTWPDGTQGPHTFCSGILTGADTFVVNIVASSGAGHDDSISYPVTLG